MQAILGIKLGMTQIIRADGHLVPCTAIEAGPCLVTDIRTVDKHGYKAVQVGFGSVKEKNTAKSLQGFYKKKNLSAKKWRP